MVQWRFWEKCSTSYIYDKKHICEDNMNITPRVYRKILGKCFRKYSFCVELRHDKTYCPAAEPPLTVVLPTDRSRGEYAQTTVVNMSWTYMNDIWVLWRPMRPEKRQEFTFWVHVGLFSLFTFPHSSSKALKCYNKSLQGFDSFILLEQIGFRLLTWKSMRGQKG